MVLRGGPDNETHVVVTMAVPSEPRKRPKAPATELPSKGNNTMSKYMKWTMREIILYLPRIRQLWSGL